MQAKKNVKKSTSTNRAQAQAAKPKRVVLSSCAQTKSLLAEMRELGIAVSYNGFNIWTEGVGKTGKKANVCKDHGFTFSPKRNAWFCRHGKKQAMWKSLVCEAK